jgi:hypothetical protein
MSSNKKGQTAKKRKWRREPERNSHRVAARCGMTTGANIVELVANPKLAAKLAERERAKRRGAPGWSGITVRYDAQSAFRLGDDAAEFDVHPRSPARRAGIRTGDVGVISVAGEKVSIENFYALRLPAGTAIGVEFYRPAAGGGRSMATTLKLAPWPRTRQWELRPRIAPGPRVLRKDRRKFLADMIPYLQDLCGRPRRGARGERRTGWCTAYAYLSFLVLIRDNDDERGIWGRQIDTAKHLGLSVRTINDLAQMLCWGGVLKRLAFPTRGRDSNLYEVTRPLFDQMASQPPAVPLPPNSDTESGNDIAGFSSGSSSIRRARLNTVRTFRAGDVA